MSEKITSVSNQILIVRSHSLGLISHWSCNSAPRYAYTGPIYPRKASSSLHACRISAGLCWWKKGKKNSTNKGQQGSDMQKKWYSVLSLSISKGHLAWGVWIYTHTMLFWLSVQIPASNAHFYSYVQPIIDHPVSAEWLFDFWNLNVSECIQHKCLA